MAKRMESAVSESREFEINGVEYVSETSGNNCKGCAFESDDELCCQAEDCGGYPEQDISPIVWKLKG